MSPPVLMLPYREPVHLHHFLNIRSAELPPYGPTGSGLCHPNIPRRNMSVGTGTFNRSKCPCIRTLGMKTEPRLTMAKAELSRRGLISPVLFPAPQSSAVLGRNSPCSFFHLGYLSQSTTSIHTNSFLILMVFPINCGLLFVRSAIILLPLFN